MEKLRPRDGAGAGLAHIATHADLNREAAGQHAGPFSGSAPQRVVLTLRLAEGAGEQPSV